MLSLHRPKELSLTSPLATISSKNILSVYFSSRRYISDFKIDFGTERLIWIENQALKVALYLWTTWSLPVGKIFQLDWSDD